MDEHEHGSMDITEHKKTFNATVKVMAYAAAVIAAILVFLAIVGT